MARETLDLLQRFQTAIAAGVGFLGVCLTLLVNAWLARPQVRDNRKHERLALARALAAELDFFKSAVNESHARDLAPVVEDIRAGGAASLRAIADELNDRGMLTRRGGSWHVSTVMNLLDRPGLRKPCASPG